MGLVGRLMAKEEIEEAKLGAEWLNLGADWLNRS